MAIERTIRYRGKEVTILWKPHLCIHSTRCWKGLPAVFKPRERPWILPDGAEGQRIIDQNFKPGFKIKLHQKDISIALKTGSELNLTLPGTETVARQMQTAMQQGNGELDHSALFLAMKD